ncbi:MAG: hypothetical protein IIW75_03915 [Bacteroidaceae bacterium]|nr:hypothetical protein [Bacteroidaceae bacterium]
MRRKGFLFLVMCMSAIYAFADKLPKAVEKARASVVSVITYNQGVMLHNGVAVFAGENGDLLSSHSLFVGADSAVVIDSKGVVRPVKYIVGVNEVFDCIRIRVNADKKIKPLVASSLPVADGETLFMLGYGVGKSGFVEQTAAERVDSVYSCVYYTLKKPMESRFLSLPVVNAKGELVALMQEAASGDTINSYAVGASVSAMLEASTATFGKGYYSSMGIRTALPNDKEKALSCLYMLALVGDSASYRNVIDDFITAYPDSYEGYVSRAEYEAVVLRDLNAAELSWEKALKLSKDAADVHFGKAKNMNTILLAGDSVSHPMLSFANVMAEFDKAIAIDNQLLYLNGKADALYAHGCFDEAAECYEALATTDMHNPEIFANASMCYKQVGNYEKSVAMLDSAVNCFDAAAAKSAAPYILTRALVYVAAEKFRNAVFDYNKYEELMAGTLGAEFYYMREQAELSAKMYQQALNDIDIAIDLAPTNIAYYVEKGLLCYRVKLSDEGIRVLDEAKALAPDIPDIHYLLGRLYMQKGEDSLARPCLEKALQLGHSSAGAVLEQLGN